MIQVCSCQFNYQYGDRIHAPYSIAILVAYLKSVTSIGKTEYQEIAKLFEKLVLKRVMRR